MKLKLIDADEVVVYKIEYDNLKRSVNMFKQIDCSVRNKTASYRIFDYGDMCEVVVTCDNWYMTIKRFDTDDQEYNRVCAEELCELLNQEQ